jgi:Second Messenger Oligonucleotide or Dinucleotide Synthetase domain
MPRTIDEGFRDFVTRLTPTVTEQTKASSHRGTIEATLKDKFSMKRFFRTGSFGNGTSITGYSDVDYFAVFPSDKLKQNSSSSLSEVRQALADRFPNTDVHVDCPAVAVPFGSLRAEHTEVVPCDYKRTYRNQSVYEIPDCAGGWMEASPEAHNDWVAEVDAKLGGKVKPLIRFLKAWKFFQNVPVSSFYLELRVTKYAEGETSIVYDIDVTRIFRELDNGGLANMNDPLGISGWIKPCSTDAKKSDALSKLSTARTRADKARAAEEAGNTSDAFYWWRLLYNDQFPTYYK